VGGSFPGAPDHRESACGMIKGPARAERGGRRTIGMHAPVELRFSAVTGGEDLLLSPGAKYGHLLALS
jgi:hypothetical protein